MLVAFVKECRGYLTKVQSRIKKCLDYQKFLRVFAKNCAAEKFINNMNMAMSSHKEFENFFPLEEKLDEASTEV